MQGYKCLTTQQFVFQEYKLIPIRNEDKENIRNWRNEQIEILRQKEILTPEKQEEYFIHVVSKLFDLEYPPQILWSFFENDILIGYGGLVHIDWESKNAEISFLTATERAQDSDRFFNDWSAFLKMVIKIADVYFNFIKIYTYAYDIRPLLNSVLEKSGFQLEARLKQHVIVKKTSCDVLIHAIFFNSLKFRMANKVDMLLYYEWANDYDVRNNSFNTDPISMAKHESWFTSKLASKDCFFYIFYTNNDEVIGQVRIDKVNDETTIGVSIDKCFRGQSLSTKILIMAVNDYKTKYPGSEIAAYIKATNNNSYQAFLKAGFGQEKMIDHLGIQSYKLVKQ